MDNFIILFRGYPPFPQPKYAHFLPWQIFYLWIMFDSTIMQKQMEFEKSAEIWTNSKIAEAAMKIFG